MVVEWVRTIVLSPSVPQSIVCVRCGVFLWRSQTSGLFLQSSIMEFDRVRLTPSFRRLCAQKNGKFTSLNRSCVNFNAATSALRMAVMLPCHIRQRFPPRVAGRAVARV